MDGHTMYDLVEHYFWDIMDDYLAYKGWHTPELDEDEQRQEEIGQTKDFQEYATNWVSERGE